MSAENQPVTSGKATALALLGVGIAVAVWIHDQDQHAPAPKPRTITRVVHETVTKTVWDRKIIIEHVGLPVWAMVVLGVVAFGVLCAIWVCTVKPLLEES